MKSVVKFLCLFHLATGTSRVPIWIWRSMVSSYLAPQDMILGSLRIGHKPSLQMCPSESWRALASLSMHMWKPQIFSHSLEVNQTSLLANYFLFPFLFMRSPFLPFYFSKGTICSTPTDVFLSKCLTVSYIHVGKQMYEQNNANESFYQTSHIECWMVPITWKKSKVLDSVITKNC